MTTRLAELMTLLPRAGGCGARWPDDHRRTATIYPPNAPRGMSSCTVCGRVVLRGEGRWWVDRPVRAWSL